MNFVLNVRTMWSVFNVKTIWSVDIAQIQMNEVIEVVITWKDRDRSNIRKKEVLWEMTIVVACTNIKRKICKNWDRN